MIPDSSDLNPLFNEFLKEHKFLPLEAKNSCWHAMKVVHHKKEPSKNDIKLYRQSIVKLQKVRGVYAYLTNDNQLLYFGKSSNVYNRVFSHYKESYKQNGRERAAAWYNFFHRNTGALTLLWRSVASDRQCIALEEMIEDVVQSAFDKKYPRRRRTLGTTS